MELKEASRPLAYPDIFWAAGDGVFDLADPALQRRVSRLRANLNHNLLVHDRVILTDTSMLVSPAFIRLLRGDGEGYQELFRDGTIVTALRSQADNYQDVAKLMIEHGNFIAEMSKEEVLEAARLLDSLNPEIVRTDTSRNQQVMDNIGRENLLVPDFWVSRGLPPEVSERLVGWVAERIDDRNLETVRQTEFWEFARGFLSSPEQAADAQLIRTYTSIASLGVMAKGFDIPPIYPAAFSAAVDRMYGTRTPFRADRSGYMELLEPFLPKDPRVLERERNIHKLAALLDAHQVAQIRERVEHQAIVRAASKAYLGEIDAVDFESDLREFEESLEVSAGEFVSGVKHREKSWLWETRAGQWARLPVPSAVGSVAGFGLSLALGPIPAAASGIGLMCGAAILLFGQWREKREVIRKKEMVKEVRRELADPNVIPDLRVNGRIELGLFGMIPGSVLSV
ncbi:hypothetical protein ACFSL4_18755 [Streptomyces caeni]|uniref:Uncharacterized protein n=1 Tax=Streptomyces caeni TaxID=2307231 RepID=A0ABW4ITG0_9ACTN